MADLKGYLRAVQRESEECRCGHLYRDHENGITTTMRRFGEKRSVVGGCRKCDCEQFRYRRYTGAA